MVHGRVAAINASPTLIVVYVYIRYCAFVLQCRLNLVTQNLRRYY